MEMTLKSRLEILKLGFLSLFFDFEYDREMGMTLSMTLKSRLEDIQWYAMAAILLTLFGFILYAVILAVVFGI